MITPWNTFVVAKYLPRQCREEGSMFCYRKITVENVIKEVASARRSIMEILIITVDVHLVAVVICMSVWVLRRIWKTDLDVLNDFRVRKGSVLLQRSYFGRSVGKPGTGEPVERRVMTSDQWSTLKRNNRLDFDFKEVLIEYPVIKGSRHCLNLTCNNQVTGWNADRAIGQPRFAEGRRWLGGKVVR